MSNHFLALFVIAAMTVSSPLRAAEAKLIAQWDKTLVSSMNSFQSSVESPTGMIVTTHTGNGESFYPVSFEYTYYDQKDRVRSEGTLPVEEGKDLWVVGVYKNMIAVRRVVYSNDSFTRLEEDSIEIYRLSAKGATLLGKAALPLVENYFSNIVIRFDKSLIVSVKDQDNEGNPTENYVLIYDTKMGNSKKISGTAKTDILNDSYAVPQYWTVSETTQSGSWPNTTTEIKVDIYK
jgi:hypothetical protein